MTERVRVDGYRLGRIHTPPRMLVRTPHIGTYLPSLLPPTPVLPIEVGEGITQWPVYLNDHLGDCACAAPAHMEEVFSKATGAPRQLTDQDVVDLYQMQGYVPGRPETDQGSSMGNVLFDWRTKWAASSINAYCFVDPANLDHLKLAMYLFRGLYIGIALPRTAQGQSVWDVVAASPDMNGAGTWGGHAVNVVALNEDGSVDFISWGQRMKMTKRFWQAYVDEAYAVVTHDLAEGATLPDNGFNLQQLEADMAELAST